MSLLARYIVEAWRRRWHIRSIREIDAMVQWWVLLGLHYRCTVLRNTGSMDFYQQMHKGGRSTNQGHAVVVNVGRPSLSSHRFNETPDHGILLHNTASRPSSLSTMAMICYKTILDGNQHFDRNSRNIPKQRNSSKTVWGVTHTILLYCTRNFGHTNRYDRAFTMLSKKKIEIIIIIIFICFC